MSGAVDYSKLSEAELDAMFEAEKAGEPVPSEPPAPEPVKDVEVPPVPEPVAPVEEAPPEPIKEPDPVTDADAELAAMDAERERIRNEKLAADLELQKAHASRLAGEIGYLREQLKTIPRASEPYEPQSQGELDRLSLLEESFAREKHLRLQSEVSQAIDSTINSLDGAWAKDLSAEIAQVIPKYMDTIKAVRESTNPDLARQTATAVVLNVKAEAQELAWQNRRKSLEEKRTAQLAELTARKKASAVSGGGAVSAPRPQPKTYDQMTAEELDAEMEKEFGRR